MTSLSVGAVQADALFMSGRRRCVERACCLAGRSQWDRKASAHAEIFGLLAKVADDPVLAPVLRGGAGWLRELMVAVGRAADGMIVNSRRRLLESLGAGDGKAASLEMESNVEARS